MSDSVAFVPIDSVRPNPKNPRLVKDERFKKLVESLQSFPEMFKLRPLLVDEEGVILAGNQRWNAAKVLGLREVPVLRAAGLSEEQKQELVIKDNVHAGDFAFASFFDNHDEWDVHLLTEWGLDLPFMPKENPAPNHRQTTDEDVASAQERLDAGYGARTGLRDVVCPNCGEGFQIDS